MKNTLETRLGLFVAFIILAAFIIMYILGGFEKFQRGLQIHALFKSAQELKLGDRVKMAGVEIGRVEKITLAAGKVTDGPAPRSLPWLPLALAGDELMVAGALSATPGAMTT